MDEELGSEYHLKKDRAGTGPFLHIFTLAKRVTIQVRRTIYLTLRFPAKLGDNVDMYAPASVFMSARIAKM